MCKECGFVGIDYCFQMYVRSRDSAACKKGGFAGMLGSKNNDDDDGGDDDGDGDGDGDDDYDDD